MTPIDHATWIANLKPGDFAVVCEHHGKGRVVYSVVVTRRTASGRIYTRIKDFPDDKETAWEPKAGYPYSKNTSGRDRRLMPPEQP